MIVRAITKVKIVPNTAKFVFVLGGMGVTTVAMLKKYMHGGVT